MTVLGTNSNWMPISGSKTELFQQLSRCFEIQEEKNPNCFPSLRKCTDIVVSSDYSGEHQQVDFSALFFLLCDWNASEEWSVRSSSVRQHYLSQGNREMAYKKLEDRNRQRALVPFLEAADYIPGLLFTLLISKRVESVLQAGGVSHLQTIAPALADWRPGTVEKLYRIQTVLAFLLAGLCHPDQRVYWLTDDDEIAANPRRLAIAASMLPKFSRSHFARDLWLGSVDTVGSMDARIAGPAKDLAAIPDLVGGALVDAWNVNHKSAFVCNQAELGKTSGAIPQKARLIIEWFRQDSKPLRRQAASIDLLEADTSLLGFSWLRFHEPPPGPIVLGKRS